MITRDLAEARSLLGAALRRRGYACFDLSDKYSVAAWSKDGAARFTLSFMPGNRRTLISHDVFVVPSMRGQGRGQIAAQARMDAARDAGVTLLLATVLNANKAEKHILAKLGWKVLSDNVFTQCALWGAQL